MWHSVLGHSNIANPQNIMSTKGVDTESILFPKEPESVSLYVPLYSSCLRVKRGLNSVKSKLSTSNPDHSDVKKYGGLLSRNTVNTNQYEYRVKGRLYNTSGREDPHKMYCGGTLFIGDASSKNNVSHQVSLEAADTIRSKTVYAQEATKSGIDIRKYRYNNGVYKTKVFMEDLVKRS